MHKSVISNNTGGKVWLAVAFGGGGGGGGGHRWIRAWYVHVSHKLRTYGQLFWSCQLSLQECDCQINCSSYLQFFFFFVFCFFITKKKKKKKIQTGLYLMVEFYNILSCLEYI